jgi:hypothetical protein
MPQEDGNVDEAQVMNIMQDRSPETLQVMAEMENQEEQTEDSFLSPKLDEQPVQEEIEEEV